MHRSLTRFLAVLLLLSFSSLALAQSSPFLPQDLHDKLRGEISGDRAFDHLRTLTQYHAPNGASRGFKQLTEYIQREARAAGLSEVQVHQLPYDGLPWSPVSAELWLLETGPDGTVRESKLADYSEVAVSIANNSRPADVETELVDVGPGTRPEDYAGQDVRGKVVLASGDPGEVEEEAVWKHGAAGIVSYMSRRVDAMDYPDQIAWAGIHAKPSSDGQQPSFAFMISPRRGSELSRRLRGRQEVDSFAPAQAQQRERLRVRAHVESVIEPPATQGLVEGWIRGKRHDQQIVLTAHVQEEKFSANDDRSGVANLLEIARSLNRLIREGKLPQPERDIRFWWANEISAEYQWFAEHPGDRKNIFVNINQDMVGALQTAGSNSRVEHITRTPWSRPTFFNDVVESVIMALYHGNNSYLAARQAGSQAPGSNYLKPILSRLGSRDRWAAEIVPYFDSTDHLVFNDGYLFAEGAPHGGITFTNWPDQFIHSSGDDMWQIDPTQMQRNAVAVAALAWYMANVGTKDVDALAAVSYPAAVARIARDLRNVAAAGIEGRATTLDETAVRDVAVAREQRALSSIQSIAPGDAELQRKTSALAAQISNVPFTNPSRSGAPSTPASQQRIPSRSASVAAYVAKVHELPKVEGLSGLMRYEALNFADGKRNLREIYAACRAESLAEGEWYYGTVTQKAIAEYFDKLATEGLITFKEQ